jgi:hypothetical protein
MRRHIYFEFRKGQDRFNFLKFSAPEEQNIDIISRGNLPASSLEWASVHSEYPGFQRKLGLISHLVVTS